MEIKLKTGKRYKICSCGLSQTLPFCDNAHRKFNSNNGTNYKSVKITSDEDTKLQLESSTWIDKD